MKSFKEELIAYKNSAENGELIFVYDYYGLLDTIVEFLLPDEYHYSEKLKVVFPKIFELLSALTPKLIGTIFTYYKHDATVYFLTEKIVQFIWHSLLFEIFEKLKNYGDLDKLKSCEEYNLIRCFEEINRIHEVKESRIPNNHIGVIDNFLWLEYLNSDWDNTYDIGFRGTKTISGIQMYDATHIRIRKCDIREDSLTKFRDTTPDQEFMIYVWVNNILPRIVYDSIIQASFADLDIFATVPRIGLLKSDYYYFGIE